MAVPSNNNLLDVCTLQPVPLSKGATSFDKTLDYSTGLPGFEARSQQQELLAQIPFENLRVVRSAIEQAKEAGFTLEGRNLGTQPLLAEERGQHPAVIRKAAVYGLGWRITVEYDLHGTASLHQGEAQRTVHPRASARLTDP